MRFFDSLIKPKRKRVSVICKKQVGFHDNIRLVAKELFERGYEVSVYWEAEESKIKKLKEIPSLKGIVFYNSFSLSAILAITNASLLLLSHSVRDGYISRRKKGRKIINLWHGVPIKGIELAMPNLEKEREKLIRKNAELYDHMIASSHVDRLAMSACFGINPNKIWVTGLPRYDLLTEDTSVFSEDMLYQKEQVKKIKKGRKLVLYAPTFREGRESPISQIGLDDLKKLAIKLDQNNAVLGIRGHRYDSSKIILDNVAMLGSDIYSETNLILSETDVLVTDFSSIWIDFLLKNKPIIGFALDYCEYMQNERGSLYDFLKIFPGDFCSDVDTLIDKVVASCNGDEFNEINHAKDIFLDYGDLPVTKNIVDKIEQVIS